VIILDQGTENLILVVVIPKKIRYDNGTINTKTIPQMIYLRLALKKSSRVRI
jgi:hypothetical protein